jgi:hypothetical protein
MRGFEDVLQLRKFFGIVSGEVVFLREVLI